MKVRNIFSSGNLFLKLSVIFFVILLSIGLLYFYYFLQLADMHFQERNQKLNADIAKSITKELKPFLNGKLNEEAADHLMHYMMAVNPSIEVYTLGPKGEILNYVVPEKNVQLEWVDLAPIEIFLKGTKQGIILGQDPRNPSKPKVFSANKIIENGKVLGYVYVILAGEEYETVTDKLYGSYILQVGTRFSLITLSAAFLIGLIAIWFITKNLQNVITTVNNFQKGEMSARIEVRKGGEINHLAVAFNEMADTIVGNIENMKSMENLRRELVGNVSHDLRTPLAVIHGYIETIMIKKDNISNEEQEKFLQRALDGTERLKKLVDELFELSKLEAKQIQPSKEAFFINELIDDISQKYTLIAEKNNITIKSEVAKEPCLVYADVSLIERVFQNLIDNAIKYTPKNGHITLQITNDNQQVEIKVSDTGEGIPAEQIPFVFDRYHIGDKRISLDKKSTGLGLAIVKRILEIHDSSIELSSKIGKGTTFSFSLPQHVG